MKFLKIVFSSLIVLSVFGCTNKDMITTQQSVGISSEESKLNIEISPNIYTPIMSSTVGILLKPIYQNINDYKLVFKTDKGFFLDWNNQVKNLGQETTYQNNNVYWSYDYEDKFTDAEIKLSVFKKSSNELVTSKNIQIKVDGTGLATVLNSNLVKTDINNTQIKIDNTNQISFKGMELYSWKEGNQQFFSLLEGTNRAKTKNEITNGRMDFNVLKTKVSELPEGEIIVFTIDKISQELEAAQLTADMQQELKNICDNKKITLTLDINSNADTSQIKPIIKKYSDFKIDLNSSFGSYSHYTSQMPGIPLQPLLRNIVQESIYQNTEDYKREIEKYKFIFKTDKGFFLIWINEFENKTKEVLYNGDIIYWSFNREDKFTEAKIELIILNKATGENIDNIKIKIEMDKEGIANVLQDYELYSWQEEGKQYFSLPLGIARKKLYRK